MRLVLFGELMLAVWLGVNWGTGAANSPGGKVVLSIIGLIVLFVLFAVLTGLVMSPFNRQPVYVPRRMYRPLTPEAREERRSDAVGYFQEIAEQKRKASASGASMEQFEAERAQEVDRAREERTERFSERVDKVRPLPPPAE